jgi:hypothetical protein
LSPEDCYVLPATAVTICLLAKQIVIAERNIRNQKSKAHVYADGGYYCNSVVPSTWINSMNAPRKRKIKIPEAGYVAARSCEDCNAVWLFWLAKAKGCSDLVFTSVEHQAGSLDVAVDYGKIGLKEVGMVVGHGSLGISGCNIVVLS